jgi:hypothetical protein
MKRICLDCPSLASTSLDALVEANPGLVSFSAAGKGVTDRVICGLALSCPNLKEISLRGASFFPLSIQLLFKSCSQLTSVKLQDVEIISAYQQEDWRVTSASMRKLTLDNVDMTVDFLQHLLWYCPHLTSLSLLNDLPDLVAINIGAFCLGLQELTIYSEERMAGEALLATLGEKCRGLRVLKIADSLKVENALLGIAEKCPLLEEVDVSECVDADDTFLTALGRNARLLRVLNVSDCVNISAEGIEAVRAGCPELVELYVEGSGGEFWDTEDEEGESEDDA